MANVVKDERVLSFREKWSAKFAGVVISLIIVVFFPLPSYSYLLKDEAHGTQLSIFGLGMIRFNYANVNGDFVGYEGSEGGVLKGFDTQEFVSLTTNGILWRDYALEGELRYNQEDDPNLNFRFKLSRDEHYLIFGDQPNIFPEPYLTRYTSPFRGLTLHIQTDQDTVEATTFGAVTRGSSEKEELIPNGTSGLYELKAIPVIPGSEIITLEVRNRNDRQQVIETIPQERNVDYTIDYDTGEITFAQPLDSETFRGDPVIIVVIYRSEAEFSSFKTGIIGARAAVSPTGWANVGVTYVSEFSQEPSLSDGFKARQEIYGIDSTIRLGEALKLTTEYAFSQNHAEPAQNRNVDQALRAKLDGKIGEQIEIYGQYHRTERDFLTFANPDIQPNEQELELVGKYFYHPKQSLETGYRFWQDNLPRDPKNATTTTHSPYIGWDAYVREHTELFSKYEFIRTTDDQTPAKTDKQTHIFLAGGVQEFLRVPALKKLVLRGEYQLSDFTDDTNQEPDTLTHQIGLQAKAEPVKDISTYVEQRERLIHDKDLGKNTEREDISELGVELKRWERFSARAKYQYKADYDLLSNQRTSETQTVILNSEYKPFSVLTSSGKLEIRDETFYEAGESSTDSGQLPGSDRRTARTINAEGRLIYTPKKDFTARLRYEYQQTEDAAEATSTTREDTMEFLMNYAFDQRKTRLTGAVKLERDLLEAPPTPRTKTRTTTYLASGFRQITDRWDVLVQYKREIPALATANYREDILGEIGYAAGRFLKFAGGYQYTRFRDQDDASKDYTANSFYVKLIGKL